MRSKMLRLLAALTILMTIVAPVGAQPVRAPASSATADAGGGLELVPNSNVTLVSSGGVIGEVKGSTEAATYIVQFVDAPLASYRGGVAGLAPTSPSATGARKLDAKSPASVAYKNYLLGQQAQMISTIDQALGRSIKVNHQYYAAFNGIATDLTPREAVNVLALDGVLRVQRNEMRQPLTDVGPTWIGAPGIWDGSDSGGVATMGEGIIVGIIDTGINMDHPSFADVGGDGYDHTNPFGAGNYAGWCETGNPYTTTVLACNDKLIGAWSYPETDNNPEDEDSHGSHTASTTAGNVVTSTLVAPTISYTSTISGVAPHANIIAYDACSGGCPLTALVASIDQTVLDGVDVINYSISGGDDPYNDSASLAFLAATDAGVFVSASAGNSGPGAETVAHIEPWVQTVAASTHNRKNGNALIDMTGGATTPPADMSGKSVTSGYGPADIVYAGDFGNPLCPPGGFLPGTFSGQIVVCDRGTYARVDKAQSVLDGGAGGFVLANDVANGDSLAGDGYALPGVHITYDDGVTLKAWLADGGAGHTATIAGTTLDYSPANGDIMAAFSSRGPSASIPDLVKPDVTAPGVDVWAAFADGTTTDPEYGFISGTSMSSPHSAGSAALMRAVHPDWSVGEVKSALMSTGIVSGVLKEDGATAADAFDIGGGRINLSQAALAGLVLDETEANYTAADPALGGDPTTLNLASLGNGACLQSCSWTRVLSSTLASPMTYTTSGASANITLTVEPAVFTIAAFGTQVITVTADVSGATLGDWAFGQVNLEPSDAAVPTQHFPVAVLPSAGTLPGTVDIATRRNAGSQLLAGITSIEVTDLTIGAYGLTQAILTTQALNEDPTNGNPYDNINDGTVFYITATVPAGTKRLVAEIVSSTSLDIDLYVGVDADGDGPEVSEEVAFSATGAVLEYVSLADPAAGTYWLLVQNWTESSAPPDVTTLASAVVPSTDEGNLTVTGPASVTAGTPYDLRVYWDTPGMVAGDKWYGAFDVGSSAGSPGDIGTVNVDITRAADDVTKSVSNANAGVGDTLTYTVSIQPNVTSENLLYTVTDTIPAGLTYISGTATGGAVVTGDTLTWSGVLPAIERQYFATTSDDDPASCGPYLDLAAFGIPPAAGVEGDTVWYVATFTGIPDIEFFGVDTGSTAVNFTDDGFAFFDPSTPGSFPYINLSIPDPADPNNLLAVDWRDFEIVYDPVITRGVSLATFPGFGWIIEYDDIQVWNEPGNTLDMEVAMASLVDDAASAYEIIYAFDNISMTTGMLATGTIGVENADGSSGTQYAYDDVAVTDGMAICFDWALPSADPVTFTYQVTVDSGVAGGSILTNNVEHDTDNPGSLPATTSVDVMVGSRLGLPIISKGP